MNQGFIKTAVVMPKVKVADAEWNASQVIEGMKRAAEAKAQVVVFPELCLTGYTCGDLFWQQRLLNQEKEALKKVAEATKGLNMIVFIGCTWRKNSKLYNTIAAFCNGSLLGVVPKMYLPNYNEFYEMRHFTPGYNKTDLVSFTGTDGAEQKAPFGTDILFACREVPSLVLAAEVCEDLWCPCPPSNNHALAGATVIVNSSASDEVAGKDDYRRMLIKSQSGRLICGYIYATCGEGESSQDLVFGGQSLIGENGRIAAEAPRFHVAEEDEVPMLTAVLDVNKLAGERQRSTSFRTADARREYETVIFSLSPCKTVLDFPVSQTPFVPSGREDWEKRCEEILAIQAMGLKKRLEHTHCRNVVIGISGGLDSTLALLVIVKAFDYLHLPHEGIHAITMPGFGTTDRTYQNACHMVEAVGANLREISIAKSVRQHFADIDHDESNHDVTYENCQARERTQILMDIANQTGGMVIGTGDMSELALGWATYNGDHMSMYGVNAGVPKTLVRHLVHYYAETCNNGMLSEALIDVLDTPVSPELLPPEEGQISQKTEDLVGPYTLHDFFLYYMLRFGFEPKKIFRLACYAFKDAYDKEVILKWLTTFYRRFFAQQFKRSCLPDGPKVGSVAVSPRGDLRMPSDACSTVWMEQIHELEVMM